MKLLFYSTVVLKKHFDWVVNYVNNLNYSLITYVNNLYLINWLNLTHFEPIYHFYAPWKHHGFMIFSGDIKTEHWLTLKRFRNWSLLLLPPPGCISKNVFSKEMVKPCFFVTFTFVISHIFPENFIEIPQIVPKTWRFSP